MIQASLFAEPSTPSDPGAALQVWCLGVPCAFGSPTLYDRAVGWGRTRSLLLVLCRSRARSAGIRRA